MTADLLVRTWKEPSLREGTAVLDPAGSSIDTLSISDLREDLSTLPGSGGWICTLTIECGTIVCACR